MRARCWSRPACPCARRSLPRRWRTRGRFSGGRTPGAASQIAFHQCIHSEHRAGSLLFLMNDVRYPTITVSPLQILRDRPGLFCELSRQQRPAVLSSSNWQVARETPLRGQPLHRRLSRMDGRTRGTTVDRTALDLVFGALEHAGVDARQRKIVWADGKRLSIEHSTDYIHRGRPGVPRHLIETHVQGWLENCAPEILLRTPTCGTRPAHRTLARRQ